MSAITMVAVGKLKAADDNLRSDVGDIDDLAASMKSLGVLEPLLVRESDMLIVAGSRRLAAAKKAGLKEVPVILSEWSEQDRVEVMIVENLQRDDLSPMEEAKGLKRLSEFGLSQRDMAARIGRSAAFVNKRLSLLELPEVVQTAVESGGIKLEAAQELARIKDKPELVEEIAERAVKEGKRTGEQDFAAKQLSSKVKSELDRREREKKLATAVKALKAERGDEKVVEMTSDLYGYNLAVPDGVAFVKPQVYQPGEVEMDPEEHRKLACSAVGVHPITLNEIEVCLDPGSHPNPLEEIKKKRAKEEEKRAKEKARQAERDERRRVFVRSMVQGKPDADLVVQAALNALLEEEGYWEGESQNELAMQLLDFGEDEMEELQLFNADELLRAKAEKTKADRLRVTLALAVAFFETHWANAPQYLELLAKAGYELTKEEQLMIAEVRAAQAKAAEEARAARAIELEEEKQLEELEAEMDAAELLEQDEQAVDEIEKVDLMQALNEAVDGAEKEKAEA